MPEIGDIARIRTISTKSATIPDVDSPEGLKAAAELVYRVVSERLTSNSPLRENDGMPGKTWQGKIQLEVIYVLWPDLNDRMYTTHERSKEITAKLYDYLKECKVLVCKQRSTKFNSAVWWVSDHWTPMDVRSVQEAPAEETPEESVQVAGDCPCRVCGRPFATTSARGTHEHRSHKVAVNAKGEILPFDDSFTNETAQNIVVDVLKADGSFLAYGRITSDAHAIDPRMGKTVTENAIAALVKRGVIKAQYNGAYPLYGIPASQVVEETQAVSELKFIPESEATVEPESIPESAPEVVTVTPVIDSLTTTVAYMQDQLSEVIKGLVQTGRGFDAIKERAKWLEARIVELEHERDALRMKFMAKGGADGSEVVRLRAQVQELAEYKVKWDNLQRALGIASE